jgi:hypothetical protein
MRSARAGASTRFTLRRRTGRGHSVVFGVGLVGGGWWFRGQPCDRVAAIELARTRKLRSRERIPFPWDAHIRDAAGNRFRAKFGFQSDDTARSFAYEMPGKVAFLRAVESPSTTAAAGVIGRGADRGAAHRLLQRRRHGPRGRVSRSRAGPALQCVADPARQHRSHTPARAQQQGPADRAFLLEHVRGRILPAWRPVHAGAIPGPLAGRW